jgi:hypothetical protein
MIMPHQVFHTVLDFNLTAKQLLQLLVVQILSYIYIFRACYESNGMT